MSNVESIDKPIENIFYRMFEHSHVIVRIDIEYIFYVAQYFDYCVISTLN
jgi:hypothetical protein